MIATPNTLSDETPWARESEGTIWCNTVRDGIGGGIFNTVLINIFVGGGAAHWQSSIINALIAQPSESAPGAFC